MTLVAGFVCRDGLLVCADMEELGVGVSKRKINKLFYRDFGGIRIVFTGAGSSAVIDNAIRRMDVELKKGIADQNALQDLVDRALLTVYENYVWPNQRVDHGIKMIVAYSYQMEQALWITHDIVSTPEVRYACAGTGEDLANYFADRLYHHHYSEQQIVVLATAIFREVKRNVSGVGQGTQMWMLRKTGEAKFYDFPELDVLERGLPSFEAVLINYGHSLTGPSIFPKLPFSVDVPSVEIAKKEEGYFKGPSIANAKEIKKLSFK